MALSFLGGTDLGSAMPWLNQSSGFDSLIDVGSGIENLFNLFNNPGKAVQKAAVNQGPTPSERTAASLYGALVQPNNSLIKQLSEDNLQRGVGAMLSQIRAMKMAGNRQLARGQRSTFFNPERADESIDFVTSRGLPALQELAMNRAREDVTKAASGFGGLSKNEYLRQQAQQRARETMAAQQNQGGKVKAAGNSIGDIMKTVGGIASIAGLFSDSRLKENVKKVGFEKGFNIYEFNYKGHPERYRGVMAQEVEKIIPEAVTEVNGFKKVNYDKIGLRMEAV